MKRLGTGLGRLRLIDGVIVAAVALLALKSIGVMSAPPADVSALAEDGLPAFGHVLAHARTNYVPLDPTTTGSVGAKAEEPAKAEGAKAEAPADSPVPPAEAAPAQVSPSERAILERLGTRRQELQDQAREMEAREKIIQDSERRLDARLDQLKALEEKGAAAATPNAAGAENAALKPIVTMYEAMKPREAARVFDRLPQEVLVPVVRQMNPRKMAEILAAMAPENAEKLTVALARPPSADPHPTMAVALPPGELPAIALPTATPTTTTAAPAAAAPRLRGR